MKLSALIACGVTPSLARLFAPHLDAALDRFDIATVPQRAGFIAQAMHESMGFARLEEALWYSKPQFIWRAFARLRERGLDGLEPLCKNPKALASAAYSNLNGNGDAASGDGWRFRGGGLFGLTGKGNYRKAGIALGRPYEERPELVRQPGEDAVLTAAWFWSAKGCNAMMARAPGIEGLDATTKRINGGMNGANDRRKLFAACTEALR